MKEYHPMQEIIFDDRGVARFRENEIVSFLLEHGNHDMNRIASLRVSQADRMQFAQLIGYSVGGFGDLSYADQKVVQKADKKVRKMRNEKT